MKCFKCFEVFLGIKLYIIHLKNSHAINANDEHICTIEECSKKLQNRSNFMKHLKKCHSDSKNFIETSEGIKEVHAAPATIDIEIPREQLPIKASRVEESRQLKDSFVNFLTEMHANSSLTKKCINDLYKSVKLNVLLPVLNHLHVDEVKQKEILDIHRSLDSFHKYQKELCTNQSITLGEQVVISRKIQPVHKKGKLTHVEVREKVSLLPFKEKLQKFLEIPGILEKIVGRMEELESDSNEINHFINGTKWRNIKSHFKREDIVIPLFLYSDDVEPDNALGSNAGNNKIVAFYYTLPVLPQHLLSSPEYVFEAMIFSSQLKKEYYRECVRCLVKVLKQLESGLNLQINNTSQKVFIITTLTLGDNLAQHEMLGFNLSFNSHRFCRFCEVSKAESKTLTKVKIDQMRTVEKYDEYFQNKIENQMGVREKSVFNDLRFLHAVENFSVDIMHDIYEGFGPSDLAAMLSRLIKDKVINLETLNHRKQFFHYGERDIGNLSKEITTQHLQTHLKMSASEFKCFGYYLPLMIGDLIPRNNKIWKIFITYTKMTEIIISSSFDPNTLDVLEKLITSYLNSIVNTLKISLKPKHHFLLHYPSVIRSSGPLRNLWCFPFEQKNRFIKQYAKITYQRVNLSHSLAYKSVTRANKFISDHINGFPVETKILKASIDAKVGLRTKIYFEDIKDNLNNEADINLACAIEHKGTLFKTGQFIFIKNESQQILYEMIEFLFEKDICHVVLKQYSISAFDTHFQSYFVNQPHGKFQLIPLTLIKTLPITIHKLYNNKTAVRVKVL